MDGWEDRWMDGQMVDEWMDRWMDGWTDGSMDETLKIEIYSHTIKFFLLKCTIQWLLVYSQSYATTATI